MKAVQIRAYGSSRVLEKVDRAKPKVGPGQLLVRNVAASVNPVDWKIRKGSMRLLHRLQFPAILGYDVCGQVEEVGSGVTRFRPKDWVYAQLDLKEGGGYAEYVLIQEGEAARKPKHLLPQEAAAVPLAALTALQALRDKAKLQGGQRLLVIGASGGVGHFAVQIAKAMGAEVTAICGTDNIAWVQSLGADLVIDYRQKDYKSKKGHFDVVFDAVGVDSFRSTYSLLAPDGIYVTTLPGPGLILDELISLVSTKRASFVMVRPSGTDLETITKWINAGKLHPVVDRSFPLAEIDAAHDYSEAGHAKGKIVIEIANEFRQPDA